MLKVEVKDCATLRIKIAEEGYSLRGFAEKVGMSPAFLSQILSGNNNPSPVIAKKIANGLKKDVNDFFLYTLYAVEQKNKIL